MTNARTAIQDFSTANKLYANAIVTAWGVLNGAKTSTKATLYASLTGSAQAANPQTLDSKGKFTAPVYIEDDVILTVTGLGNVPDHDTGVVSVPSVRSADVAISSAEILDLHATPKTLVAAPGANKLLLFDKAVFFLDYNSAAYAAIAGSDDLNISYTDENGVVAGTLETTGFLDQTADKYAAVNPKVESGITDLIAAVNAPLVASLAGAVTTGDSPIGARIFYRIVDLSTLSAS